jgi:hypothetical protein
MQPLEANLIQITGGIVALELARVDIGACRLAAECLNAEKRTARRGMSHRSSAALPPLAAPTCCQDQRHWARIFAKKEIPFPPYPSCGSLPWDAYLRRFW